MAIRPGFWSYAPTPENIRHLWFCRQARSAGTEQPRSRPSTYRAAIEYRTDVGRYAPQAKLYASEAANRACAESLWFHHGGNGFHADHEISRLYRDVRVTTIFEGTSEMQRLVISRHLLR
ncbi:MAG TPA: acyl-CoA dehydrogenase family protein [Thermoanaerobaculia bacterium]|nr:acyl-CoA dehydrogenase family protein [Thermoanaerobaculia bacterium]